MSLRDAPLRLHLFFATCRGSWILQEIFEISEINRARWSSNLKRSEPASVLSSTGVLTVLTITCLLCNVLSGSFHPLDLWKLTCDTQWLTYLIVNPVHAMFYFEDTCPIQTVSLVLWVPTSDVRSGKDRSSSNGLLKLAAKSDAWNINKAK